MTPIQDTVPYNAVGVLLLHLERRGFDGRALCRNLGLPEEPPDDPDLRIPISVMQRVWPEAFALTGDPALALHVGETHTTAAQGIVGHLAAHAATAGEALQSACRYFLLLSGGMSLDLAAHGGQAALIARSDGEVTPQWRLTVERTFAAVIAILQQEAISPDKVMPAWVEFSFAEPAYGSEYRRIFGEDCRFGSDRDALVFSQTALAVPLVHRHERLHKLLAGEAATTLSNFGARASLKDRLIAALPGLLNRGSNTARQAATSLGVSERTLHRRLAEEGTAFQSLVDETRKTICLSLMADRQLSIEQIAFLCGFSESSGFFRAFKRWTGRTPAAHRKLVPPPRLDAEHSSRKGRR